MSGNSDLDNMTLDQLQALKNNMTSQAQGQATTASSLDNLSLAQLQGLKQSHMNALNATGTQDPNNLNNLGSGKDMTNPLIPIGAGLVDIGNNAKLLADDLFASKQKAQTDQNDIESEKAQYANTPVGKSAAASFLQGATEVGTYAATAGALAPTAATGLASFAGNAAINGAIGAYQDPGQDGSRLENAATSAILGAGIQGALGKLGSGLGNLGQKAMDANPAAVTLGQATDNKVLLSIDKALSDAPYIGTKTNLTNQITETKAAVDQFFSAAQAQPTDTLGADLANSMARMHAKVSDISDAQYAKVLPQIDVAAAKTPINMDPVNLAAGQVVAKLSSLPASSTDPVVQSALASIKAVVSSPPTLFSDLSNLQRYSLGQYLDLRNSDKTVAAIFKPLTDALSTATQQTASAAGYGQDFNNLAKFYRDRVLPFRSIKLVQQGVQAGQANIQNAADLANGVTGQLSGVADGVNPQTAQNISAINPSSIINKFLKDTPPEQLKPLVASLDQDGKNALKNGILHTMLTNNLVQSGPRTGDVNLISLGNDVKSSFKNLGLVMDSTSTQQMQGVMNMLDVIKKNPLMFQKEANWFQGPVAKYGAIAATVHHFSGPVGVGALAALTKGVTSLTSTKTGLQLVKNIGKYSIKDPKLPGVARDLITRYIQLQATQPGTGIKATSGPVSGTNPFTTAPVANSPQPAVQSSDQPDPMETSLLNDE